MYRKRPDGWYPDDFAHEQSLVLDTAEGLVIFNSCSHGGAANIISEVAGFFPGRNVHAIIGGFHLYNKSEGEVRDLGRKIKETGIKYVCTGHCTGESAYGILEQELGDILHQLHTGLVMEFSE
ncbi:MAG: MBL fold metallo-hydrolase [Anaerovoracaceae bacterium]